MHRLQVYVRYLHHLPPCLEQVNLENRLAILYAEILRFLAKATDIYEKSNMRRTFAAYWKISDIEEFEITCRKTGEDIEIESD